MHLDHDSSFNDVSVHTVGSVIVETHFVQAADRGAAYPPLAMVFVSPERCYIVLQDAVTDVWSSVENYIPPVINLKHVNTGRQFD